MMTIRKLAITSFRLGMPKFSKISFTMTVDRNAVIKLHKSGKSNAEIAKRLTNSVKDREEVPGDRKHP